MHGLQIEYHPLKPFVNSDTRLLLLGSFPPPRKRWSVDFFYPNFLNDMWRIMGLIFYSDKQYFVEGKRFRVDTLKDFLAEKGIGVFDTATAVRRLQGNASDKYLEIVEPTDIRAMLKEHCAIEALAATGEKAALVLAETLGTASPRVGGYLSTGIEGRDCLFFRMPSSSRAYPLALEKKAAVYRNMFETVGII